MRLVCATSLVITLASPALAAPTFTGNVPADFTGTEVRVLVDPGGLDVSMPAVFPPSAISGHDIEDVRVSWDRLTDTLYVGIHTSGIAGDADGDGNAGRTGATLASTGGVDQPHFGGGESFAVYLDLDEDGTIDLIAGVRNGANASAYEVSTFSGPLANPANAFGTPQAAHTGALFTSPTAAAPHLEMTITQLSAVPTSSGFPIGTDFAIGAFIGSSEDGTIGEDFSPGFMDLDVVDLGACGDGLVLSSEACDDGNLTDGDGCDSSCEVEADFVCACAGGPDIVSSFDAPSSRVGSQGTFAGVGLCADNEVLKGVTGTYVDGAPGAVVVLDPICARPSIDAVGAVNLTVQAPDEGIRPTGLPVQVPVAGYTLLCPGDQAVTGLLAETGNISTPRFTVDYLNAMQILCADLTTNGDAIVPVNPSLLPQVVGNSTGSSVDSTQCPTTQVASGLGGWGDMSTSGLRLGCADVVSTCDRATSCRPFALCGDGILEGTEACDDGNMVNGDGCTTDCAIQDCGDGIIDPGEDCDGGPFCSSNCETAFAVGDLVWFDANDDGIKDSTEPGIGGVLLNLYDDRGRLEASTTSGANGQYVLYAPPGGWTIEVDITNFQAGGALESYSRPGPTIRSRQVTDSNIDDADFPFIAFCGDGITQDWEECDDGNTYPFDTCTGDCLEAICGDGITADFETCDDGNSIDNDSCSNSCGVAVCGDGVVSGLEDCDDGNDDLLDGCHECQTVALCGNELCCTLDVSGIVFNKDCNFEGAIFLQVSDANGDVDYTWSDGSTDGSRDPLAPGVYTVVVEDAACSVTRTFSVEDETTGNGEFVGMAAVTTGTSGFYLAEDQYTLGVIDVTGAVTGALYDAPMFHNPEWTAERLGNIFGVTYDRRGNFYVTATSSVATYLGPDVWRYGEIGGGADDLGAAGTVYKIGIDGIPVVFAQLPQQPTTLNSGGHTPRFTGPGLGNIAYDRDNGQFFVTNFEDGAIYRLAFDGTIEQVFDPMGLDDGSPGMVPLGERTYGVDVYDGRLYYSVWTSDLDTIRSVAILPDGDLDEQSDRHEFTTNFNYFWNPVTDISISRIGRMAISQRTMRSDLVSYNHLSDVAIWDRSGSTWTFTKGWGPAVYDGHAEAYGGVSWSDDDTIWASSADILDPRVTHGIVGRTVDSIPGDWTGGTPATAKVIKYDALNFRDTKGIGGDVDIIVDVEVNECVDDGGPIIPD